MGGLFSFIADQIVGLNWHLHRFETARRLNRHNPSMRNSRSLYQPHNNRPGFTGHKRIHIFSIPSCLGNNHFCFLLVESLPKLLVFQIDLDIFVLGIVNRHMHLLWRSRHGTWSEVRWLFRHLCRMVRRIWKRPV